MPKELWMEICNIVQEAVIKLSPRKRNAKRQNGCLRRPYKQLRKGEAKGKGEKERDIHLNAEFQRTTREDKKAFLSEQCKETEENNRRAKTRHLLKNTAEIKGTFQARMSMIKDRIDKDITEAEEIKKRWQENTEFRIITMV